MNNKHLIYFIIQHQNISDSVWHQVKSNVYFMVFDGCRRPIYDIFKDQIINQLSREIEKVD